MSVAMSNESGLFLPQALVHCGDPDPARPVPAQSHLESPQVLGHRAARREGSQLCRQVLRSLGSVLFDSVEDPESDRRIRMLLGLPDPDPSARGTDPDPDPDSYLFS